MVNSMDDFTTYESTQMHDDAEDLKRIEQEVVEEAEASVEDYDAMGDEYDAVEAAETAFTFDEAQRF